MSDFADLAPAYVLGALSPEETRAFEAALAGSPELQREVAEYREVCALLPSAESGAPPAALKQRLLERVREGKGADLTGRGTVPSASGSLSRVTWGTALAAAVVLAVVYMQRAGDLRVALRDRDSTLAESSAALARREAELDAILAPGVQLITLTTTGQAAPVAQVFWDRVNNTALLHARRLRPAPSGRAYQLWLLPRQGNPIASSVFNTDAEMRGLVISIPVPAGQEIAGFALTEEPAAGSPQPTSTPFLAGMAGTAGTR